MILLLTFTEDFYTVDLVKEGLERRGFKTMRINLDSFPIDLRITKTISGNETSITFRNKEVSIDTSTVQAVWLRKYWTPRINPDIDPQYREGCYRESKEVLDIFLHTLAKVPFIDPLDAVQKAGNKFFQLEAAKELGIRIPNTLITNDPEELKKFYSRSNTEVVAKMLTALTASMQSTSFFLYTSKVSAEDVEDAEMLSDCPMTFQEYITKAYELRIIYVDGNFYTGKIDSSRTKHGQVDWRKSQPDEVDWEAYELPGELKQKLVRFMNKMGLIYGAIDMIRSIDGEYVFLEVNPIGEWGMLQRDLGLPVSEGIADALIRRIKK